ncbi:hypothetical protein GLOIN_2v1789812 [Rhizophagus irregularis DAOM 181602=DAOM 197198]|uniref:Uncharacterized protein n=1 Tax=Rhizophagus irregularis (strain DAOM 181602 / DAOM 197198 / MUCL 43194) TaxID=747089 RepID=U9SWS1_RHIID|nr:hypothetical protein GLOIN_2v1789812 [Rhizophagus irregularis DAOM 181602=DAOM 197198]POG58878.1 hypothetical protein GLOIN_2v1789812 [Rhizophagus irregularis DAOM 181602=DAOM 197198]CAG8753499.1 22709_t:CDS:2 [Rhizophagus irregularis]|eukprot:XP_025165744.1 hypothetical protein GLOIN_2v1789812 [Rhizophagus irregularis DAOM 181602=DAOM 197198]
MSSKNDHEQRTPNIQKINLSNMRTIRKPQRLCPYCKETNDCNKIEEVIDNFHENPIKQNKAKSTLGQLAKISSNNLSQAQIYELRFIKKLFKIL